jgi:thermostable 8-oxoguanine DNA glycosylase
MEIENCPKCGAQVTIEGQNLLTCPVTKKLYYVCENIYKNKCDFIKLKQDELELWISK